MHGHAAYISGWLGLMVLAPWANVASAAVSPSELASEGTSFISMRDPTIAMGKPAARPNPVQFAQSQKEIKDLQEKLNRIQKDAERASKPLVGTRPPSGAPVVETQEQAERSKERAIRKFEDERRLDLDRRLQDLAR